MSFQERLRYVRDRLDEYPFKACAPIGEPRPEALERDPVLNQEYVVVPFGGEGESGWAVWMFPRRVLRDTFVRRYRKARDLNDIRTVAYCKRASADAEE